MADADTATKRVGTVIAGKYRIRRLLGVGGMGAVYAAVHGFTGRYVAIKVLDPAMSQAEGFTARFLREARAASDIGHPAICDVFDAGQEEDGSLYLVLELLEGRNMGDAIETEDLSLDEILEIGVQVLDGLAAAHDRGIVHRDIKPENIFLTRDDKGNLRVKILDFGVAKKTRGKENLYTTRAGSLIGTPYYMSPEQAQAEEVDHRSDLWSTGAMLYHALAGHPPIEEDSYNKMIIRLASGAPPASLGEEAPELPGWLITVVDRALIRDRDERWQSARQMAHALRTRGEVPMGLEWEAGEDETQQTVSPFEAERESFDSLPDPRQMLDAVEHRPGHTPAPVDQDALTATVSARPGAHAPVIPQTSTPNAWDREAPPRARPRRRSGFVVGALTGGLAVLIGAGVLLFMFRPWETEPVAIPLPPEPPSEPPGPPPLSAQADREMVTRAGRLRLTGEGLSEVDRVAVGGVPQPYVRDGDALVVGPITEDTPAGTQSVLVEVAGRAADPISIQVASIVINEVDPRAQNGATFVELSAGLPEARLEGLTLVAYDSEGHCVVAVPALGRASAGGLLVLEMPQLPDTGGAVALYEGVPADFPLGTTPQSTGLVDAVVYSRRASSADAVLMQALLAAGEAQAPATGDNRTHSLSRCSAGRRDGRAFAAAEPTRGAPNVCPPGR